jgi:bidirectional [NiFe] hydrogenase diaphorase subunit
MQTKKKLEHPSNDKRWRLVDATMRRHGHSANGLIETLHTVQESFGFLEEASLKYVGQSLTVPLSKVYGVATFYHLFTLKPQGKHTCVICLGTACYIKGTAGILDRIDEVFGVKAGETTKDNQLSVLTARCVGSCGLAPAVVFDGEVKGKQTADQTVATIQSLLAESKTEVLAS